MGDHAPLLPVLSGELAPLFVQLQMHVALGWTMDVDGAARAIHSNALEMDSARLYNFFSTICSSMLASEHAGVRGSSVAWFAGKHHIFKESESGFEFTDQIISFIPL